MSYRYDPDKFDVQRAPRMRPDRASRFPHLVQYEAECGPNERDWREVINARLKLAVERDRGTAGRDIADVVGRWITSDGKRLRAVMWVEWSILEAFTEQPREVVNVKAEHLEALRRDPRAAAAAE